MNLRKLGGYCSALLLLAIPLQGCDDIEENTTDQPSFISPVSSALDDLRFVGDFTISNPHHVAKSDTIETTVACDTPVRVPLTVRLHAFQSVNKEHHWTFHIENHGTRRWAGTIRIFLISHEKGEVKTIYHEDVDIDPPIEVTSMVGSRSGLATILKCPYAPRDLQGNIDQYGWSWEADKHPSKHNDPLASFPQTLPK